MITAILPRLLYSLAWWLAMPVVFGRLWWRGRQEPGYRQHVLERIGIYGSASTRRPASKTIWVHAVSVGETRAAEPLIHALLDAYPHHTIVLTHMTPTGRAAGLELFGKYAPRVVQCYLPYDISSIIGRFISHFVPILCVLMETEVWPNAMHVCARRGIPVLLANARMSERSLAKGLRLSALMADAARALTCVGAQTRADAARLQKLGAQNVHVTGSIKFDVTPPPIALSKGAALRAQIGTRKVLLCASTRDGEEKLILDAFAISGDADMLLVIVPRHPQRFDDVAALIAAHQLTMARRSTLDDQPLPQHVRVLLGDSMGEMFAYQTACDVAFIGGSLLPLGGQNLIEACAVGKPVLIGPHTFNFADVSDAAVEARAAIRVADATEMLSSAVRLLGDDAACRQMGEQARAFAMLHRGATARTMALLAPLIK